MSWDVAQCRATCHTPVSEASSFPMGPPSSPVSAPGKARPLQPWAKTAVGRPDLGPEQWQRLLNMMKMYVGDVGR